MFAWWCFFLSHFEHKVMTQNCFPCHASITKQYNRTATPATFWSQNNHAKLILLPHLDRKVITQNCYSCHTSVMKQSFRIDTLANSGSQSSYWKLFLLSHFVHETIARIVLNKIDHWFMPYSQNWCVLPWIYNTGQQALKG